MKIIHGDIIELMKLGEFDVMVHGCNCQCTMGSGVARAVRATFPKAYEVDLSTKNADGKAKLGHFTLGMHHVGDDPNNKLLFIVNAYTQLYYGREKKQYVDYDAVRSAFKGIANQNWVMGRSIAYPMIGAGLGGGDWDVISKIIDEELDGLDHTLVMLEEK